MTADGNRSEFWWISHTVSGEQRVEPGEVFFTRGVPGVVYVIGEERALLYGDVTLIERILPPSERGQ